jgi:O-antigen ligase
MRANLRAYALLTVVLLYTLMIGATYNGILTPDFKTFSVAMIGIGLLFWTLIRRRWRWHITPLDTAVLLWVLALAVSTIANLESWRRIALGVWYVGLYILLWYALFDALANRAVRRETLIDALLTVGFVIVLIGGFQFINTLSTGVQRPVSTFGNSNTLAAFIVLLIPFITERIGTRRALPRAAMTVFALFTMLLLLFTFSRGAYIALATIFIARIAMYAFERRLFHTETRRAFFAALTPSARTALGVGALLSVVAFIGAALFLVATLSIGGRGLDFRTFLYDSALRLTLEQPVTGHGLFTFGGGLARLNSTPPREPHAHAHNLVLGVTAELGMIGLFALAFTGWAIYRAARRNVVALEAREKRTLRPALIALIGFAAHHLLDFPSITPAIFITMLIILALAIVPPDPIRTTAVTRRVMLAFGAVALIVTGVFGAATYHSYINILNGVTLDNAAERAAALDAIITLDPAMPVYHQQQGYLYAIARDYPRAAAAFERYTTLAPEYVAGWINLAAVYDALADRTNARIAIDRAAQLAPQMSEIAFARARYQSAVPVPERWHSLDPFAQDYPLNENINAIQFLRLAIRRQVLPIAFLSEE